MKTPTLEQLFSGQTDDYLLSYDATPEDFDLIVDEFGLDVEEENGVKYTYDPETDDLVGEYDVEESVYYTDLDLDYLLDDDLAESHLKSDGTLDFRKMIGKVTRKYQNHCIEGTKGTFASPVSGDSGEQEVPLIERIVKRVNAKGTVTRVRDRATRRRKATATTGMSPAMRKKIARKAARTKRRNPRIAKIALRKRRKALRKRKSMGLK